MKYRNGFTLIELMVVVTIIGILASISLPAYQNYVVRSEIVEALSLANYAQRKLEARYENDQTFALNNEAAGLPPADKIIGNRVTQVAVDQGVINVTFGHKASRGLQGLVMSIRPAVVIDSPLSPIAWLCGYSEPVNGMRAIGDNQTNVPNEFLPASCVN